MNTLQASADITPGPIKDRSRFTAINEFLLVDDMQQFHIEVEEALNAQSPYLTELELEMLKGGKKIRPTVMLLTSRMIAGDGPLPLKVYKGAASLEMLHIATLIHDDIVDEAPLRRGLPSVSASRGIKTALLVSALRQAPHFVGNHSKAATGLTGTSSFDSGIER